MGRVRDIRSLPKEELTRILVQQGQPSFRANQIYEWLWNKSARTFEDMTNLPKDLRQWLDENYAIQAIEVDKLQRSSDGTIKNAVRLHDGFVVESVLIPTDTRSTACVSSQVGCSLDCTFCATSRLKRMRNLEPGEIYDQVVTLNTQSQSYYGRPLSNIVFMGMGEPLMNYPNLISSIEKICSPKGLGMAAKRITVSTSGIPKLIKKLAEEPFKFNLAVSLHSAIEETRNRIMPFTTRFPLPDLLDSLKYWYEQTGRPITFEYVVWKGINDQSKDAQALVRFCRAVPSKVNLIEYNAIGDPLFQQADAAAIDLYVDTLEKASITVTVRRSRGQDIDAACGQLANKSVEKEA